MPPCACHKVGECGTSVRIDVVGRIDLKGDTIGWAYRLLFSNGVGEQAF